MGREEEPLSLAQSLLGPEFLQGLAQLLHLRHDVLRLVPQFAGLGLQGGSGLEEHLLVAVHHVQGRLPGGGLDAAHAGGHRELAGDVEHPRLGGVVQMGSAAELHGVPPHVHHPDGVAVLLAEQGGSAGLLGLLDVHHLGVHRISLQDGLVHQAVHLAQLLRRHGGEVGEVEAEEVGLHQGAGLMHVVAQHGLEGLVQQMGSGVGPLDSPAALGVDGGGDRIPHLHIAGEHPAVVHIFPALVLLYVADLEAEAVVLHHAVVGHLAAHLGVEGSLIQHQDALGAGAQLLPQLLARHQGQHLPLGRMALIAQELGGGHILAKLHAGPAQVAQGLPGLPGPGLLLLHQGVEGGLVQLHALVLHHLDGQVDGEAVGVIQLEGVRPGEGLLPPGLVPFQHLPEDLQAAVDGLGEVLLLHPDDLGDIVLALPQLRIVALVLVDDGVAHLIQEGVVHPQQLAVAGGPAQQTAEHIAPALVGGEHAVTDHEGGGADVVCDDPEGHVLAVALAVVGAGDLGHLVGDVHHGVHIKEGVHPLAHAGQALQSHAGVDVLLLQLSVVALPVVVELGEDDVPHLDIAVAVAAHSAPRLAAAIGRAPVVVDLGAGAAGAGAVLPEVVLLAELEDALGGDADLLVPDAEGLVVGGGGFVAGEHGGVEPVGLQAHPLGGGQELPGPVDGVPLEVVAKGEVAQHLKVGAVAGGVADVLDIAGADALLAGGHPVAGRLLLPGEPGLHGRHAAVDEQQGGVVLGDQGEAGQAEMSLALKKRQEHLPQFIQAKGLGLAHGGLPPIFFHVFLLQITRPYHQSPRNRPVKLFTRLDRLQLDF